MFSLPQSFLEKEVNFFLFGQKMESESSIST
jgi:hypothetical protein